MILSALMVTGEYRTGMIRTTFMAAPNRTLVLVAKAAIAAMFSAICASVSVVASVVAARLFAASPVGPQLSFTSAGTWHTVGGIAGYAAAAAVLGVSVGALLRHSAAAVALLALWPLVAEPLLANLPRIGTEVGPYLPFGNAFQVVGVAWLYPEYRMPWSVAGSLLYFAAVTAALLLAAVIVLNRRDA
jgi:hypothetical protein